MLYLICLVAGLISAAGFVPTSFIVAPFIAYSLLFYALNKAKNKKQSFFFGFLFGFGQGAISMAWLINALLIDGGTFAWAIPLVPIGFGILFGLFFSLCGLSSFFASTDVRKICTFAGALCIAEWVRSWFLTGFPWNLAGSAWLICLPVLQSLAFFGIYGLSLFSVLWFSIPYLLYKRHIKVAVVFVMSFLFVLMLGFLRIYSAPQDSVWGVKLRLVQPNIPQTLKWNEETREENYMLHISMSRSNEKDKITHVLWPEAASTYYLDINERKRADIFHALRQDQTLLAGSMRAADIEKRQAASSILVIDHLSEIKAYADKSHLVPFGEYLPLRGLFTKLGLEKLVPIPVDLKPGNGPRTLSVPHAPPVGASICYEIIFPHEVVDQNHRPKWIFNATNDSWYGMSAGPYQHLGAAQMRAVEEGLPVVRVANGGISAVISPTGKILSSLPLNTKGVLDSPLPVSMPQTPYAKLGNWIPLIIAFLFAFFGLYKNQKNLQL